ncbi:unnamed protein product [Parnassius mnemosyne]|uniref:Uncharacterized protein n=1 Tax=Parnassius mnemosyne TaxID=213953 RepID=A0AAV1LMP4_9NEOP
MDNASDYGSEDSRIGLILYFPTNKRSSSMFTTSDKSSQWYKHLAANVNASSPKPPRPLPPSRVLILREQANGRMDG